ncbi:MAG TPA: phage tail protein [Kofleriaceae bacterium]|nr:phage tail protein [Kofleriaceae bacterium]
MPPFQRDPKLPDSKLSHAAGFFALSLDKKPTTAYLKSVEGGHHRAAVIDEPIGPDTTRVKHISTVEIEPISIEFGISGAEAMLQWIQQSWKREYIRHNGQITHANFDRYQTFVHEFRDALITETTFPTLDGSSKEAAYLKVKIQPEHVTETHQKGPQIDGNLGSKQKMWMCSGYRFTIDHVDGFQYTNKLDSFTIKQGIKKLYTGGGRLPEIEPTKIDFPNLTGTVSLAYAKPILDWYQKYVVEGSQDPGAQQHGAIEFLSPDRASTLFKIQLYGVGIHHAEIVASTANSDQLKRVKYELYVESMELDGSGALGME